MKIEYEATFSKINKNEVRQQLQKSGAKLIKPEFIQKRVVFHLPKGHEKKEAWARVRDEGDKITLSVKQTFNGKIEDQKEICLKVDDFKEAVDLLKYLGCREKAFQETKRELWKINNTEVTIDEWPFLEPFVEIESNSEEEVKMVAEKLGFDYSKAFFGAVGGLYSKKYNLSEDIINHHTPEIKFAGPNPFIS